MIGFLITFFPIFDVPVFWPILLMYWMVLLFVTMKRQIKHMIKYRYIPFSLGKKVPLLIPFAQSNPAVLLWCPRALCGISLCLLSAVFLRMGAAQQQLSPTPCTLTASTPCRTHSALPSGLSLPPPEPIASSHFQSDPGWPSKRCTALHFSELKDAALRGEESQALMASGCVCRAIKAARVVPRAARGLAATSEVGQGSFGAPGE